jgi:CDP-4-dehydro-6-deoxyglucose reductase, E1
VDKCIAAIFPLVKEYYDRQAAQVDDAGNEVRLSAPAFDEHEAMRAISTILGGWISQGKNVREFEESAARYFGTGSGIAVNSGSSANLIALLALKEHKGIEDGAEVIVPAATFATVSMPVIQAGLVPVYVDVDLDSLNISPDAAEAAISERTKILMPVHTLGYPAEMDQLMAIAAKHDLAVLEDCCEAHGSALNGQKVSSFGDVGTYSFFVAHNMTTGEGGMVMTSNADIDRLCRSYREFGRYKGAENETARYYSDDVLTDYDVRYVFDRLGYNLRMTDVTAAFGIEQLKKLDGMNDMRRANAAELISVLNSKTKGYLSSTEAAPGHHHTYYTFPILLHESAPFTRRQFAEYLEARNIETRPLFAGCLPDQPAFRNAPGRNVGELPCARYLRDNLIFIGIHPGVTKKNIGYLSDVIVEFISSHT